MLRSQIYLSEAERQGLQAMALRSGRSQSALIREAIDAYKRAVDEGRIARSADGSGYPPSLDVLVDGASDAQSPTPKRIYFLRKLPRDPFYDRPGAAAAETWGLRAYASPPDAPFAGEDVFDVYSLSARSGLNGVAYRAW